MRLTDKYINLVGVELSVVLIPFINTEKIEKYFYEWKYEINGVIWNAKSWIVYEFRFRVWEIVP